jgi:hypothetical protein
MSGETANPDRSAEKIRIGWPGFASVSESEPSRFQRVVETDEFADDAAPQEQALELAGRSVAEGASLASVARWFDVPASELAAWISQECDDPASHVQRPIDPEPGAETHGAESPGADEVAPAQIVATTPLESTGAPLRSESEAPTPVDCRDPGKPAAVSPRPSLTISNPTVYSSSRANGTRRRPDRTSPMGFSDSLHMLRRRFLVVVAGLVLSASAGWLTAPGETAHAASSRRSTP